jgi:adenylate kinase
MLNIVLFGPPGAGKGTQSENIIKKYNLVHISTGDILRRHQNEGTELGILAKSYSNKGNLVPDDVVIQMVKETLQSAKDSAKGFIFDGFPRTVAQAKALDTILDELGLSISCMIALDVPDEELRVRIRERAKTSGRIDDQDPQKIENRIRVYKEETAPVADFYRAQGKYNEVNGVGTIEQIFESIEETVAQF